MLDYLPFYVPLIFILVTIATLCLFYWILRNADTESTRKKAVPIVFILIAWLIVQGAVALIHVYSSNTNAFPPKIMLFGILPMLLTILFLFTTVSGRRFMDSLPLRNITWLNIVRIPVELILLALFLHKAVPQHLTFEGGNFDIFSGISAPFVAYFGFTKKKLGLKLILLWNFICLALVLNVFVTALLSAPFPFQKLAFDQPNIAILYFPFNWLPTFVVPVVIFGHLVSIKQLIRKINVLGKTNDSIIIA